ncbi:membrane protein insertase YidC [Flavobacterium columnare]|uniref:membrane protein insertase YidC n=1 Tax=Flavobacterium columnare TaxID=996 RepID=UPI0018967AE7|nr:membrane protein insertase YidC [Flavobacterium columnare]MBF6654143.1 membrane protein insertase YidC [Flavobacterium columnare]
MEEKKLDLNSIIGFTLIFGIMMWIMYKNQPTQAEIDAEKAKKEKIVKAKKTLVKTTDLASVVGDSTKVTAALKATLGSFAYSATLPSAKEEFTTLENELIRLKIANKGGNIVDATLKNFKSIDEKGPLVQLIKNNNAQFNLAFQTKEGKNLNTKDLFFEPTLSKVGGNQVLSMRLKTAQNAYLEYKYVLKPNDYMLDFDVRSQGLATVFNTSVPANLIWDLKTYRNEKSVSYENRYTEVVYEYEEGKDNYLNQSDEEEQVSNLTYVAFKQHFFSSILLTKTPVKVAKLSTQNLVKDAAVDTTFTKKFGAILPLAYTNGELDYKMNWYYGPSDYKILNAYDRNLDEIIPLGWGIFGWINKFIFVPLFGLMSTFLPYGIAIILFTVLIKLTMSPFTYKSFLSQAKMKVLRPEMNEINEKFSKDPMKKQQETMKLYNKAGVNPMAGCIPALIQLPFMYASFQFFPSAIQLRQQGFLWAKDLSSYDLIAKLPFNVPLYGDHISLFPILAAIAIFFYMKYTTGDQAMSAPPQEGMPDMAGIMKMMIWISPIMMLIFFNNYGSGLSLYNLFSNLMTLGLMFYIKSFLVDDAKIHAQIQENKQKEPKKPGKFQQKLQQAMEQAQKQQEEKKRK